MEWGRFRYRVVPQGSWPAAMGTTRGTGAIQTIPVAEDKIPVGGQPGGEVHQGQEGDRGRH